MLHLPSEEDNAEHILVQCGYAREVWHRCFDRLHLPVNAPRTSDTFLDWWLRQRTSFRKDDRRGFDSLVTCTAWALWKQRNARVFNRPEQQLSAAGLGDLINNEIRDWRLARNGVGGLLRFTRE